MRAALSIGLLMLSVVTGGCDGSQTYDAEQDRAASKEATDTGEVFALTPKTRKLFEQKAARGDSEAALKIALHYGMAGGDNGITDPNNSIEEERWLKRAADLGNETAKLNWAVKIGPNNCTLARKTLDGLLASSSDSSIREGAQSWLRDRSLCSKI